MTWEPFLAPALGLELNIRLLVQYVEPHRRFHTLVHLNDLINYLRWFEYDREHHHDDLFDNEAIRWAIAFHDWYYVPGAQDNESRSADAALGFLCQYVWPEDHERMALVTKAIRATQHHNPVEITDRFSYCTGLMCDCDLAGLGSAPEDYKRTSALVRDEYTPVVGHTTFNTGRLNWIQSMLDRPRLYSHDDFYERFEEQARTNLRQERSETLYHLTSVWVRPDEWKDGENYLKEMK